MEKEKVVPGRQCWALLASDRRAFRRSSGWTARPIPIPVVFVVWNGSKSLSMPSDGMPTPASLTVSLTLACPSGSVRTTKSRGRIVDAAHRLRSVVHQVQDHLLKLNTIANHVREAIGQLGA